MQAATPAGLVQRELSQRAVLRRWRFASPAAYAPKVHDGVEIASCAAGRVEYAVEGRLVELTPGGAVVIPAGVAHATRVLEPGTSAESIHVPGDAFAAAADAAGSPLRGPRLVAGRFERPSTLAARIALLVREAAADALLVDALTDAVVVEALRAGSPSAGAAPRDGRDPRVRRAVDLIHARYGDPLTIDELARAAHVSRFHFGRLFRIETGKTPYRYLLDVRMTRAAELLRTRRCPVTEAALSVGCNDLGRFGRMFRQAHGVRPSEYLRAAWRAG